MMDLEEIKSRINPQYQDWHGTESYERKWLCDEIESLRQQLAECEKEKTALNRIAGDMEEKLSECERERDELRTEVESEQRWASFYAQESMGRQATIDTLTKQCDAIVKNLAAVTAERDELVAAVTKFLAGYDCEEPHQGLIVEGIERMREVLAKVGADKDQQARDYAAGLAKGIRSTGADKTGEV